MNEFEAQVSFSNGRGLYARGIEVLQVNVGLMCNHACVHCHLGASPDSSEVMDSATMAKVLGVVDEVLPKLVDITGGAPELNPELRDFIEALSERKIEVQVRTNLTALLLAETEGLAEYFRDHRVCLVGSMPCYLEENVEAQRGRGTYNRSIEAITLLNALGYGVEPELQLNLVYNPGGAFLPGDQSKLEKAYKKELMDRFGITFSRLLTITNMPIGRFRDVLKKKGELEGYVGLLKGSFNSGTLKELMCRDQISIAWDGTLYDCDFNLSLGMMMNHGAPDHLNQFEFAPVASRRIVTGQHCFGCTAGDGSSCSGSLVTD